ncbi:uncharacterized protein BX663DRAFT_262258 [Cokeromyces recurvatus]|uniref:uncharacterized protein n=1 Tax=Cokeromyces recurvatus TaxID=90255 RepID=UPI002220633B|nr:uncharacterized protein BX663DRAFT_262258 [Cokeromyces recurvatus]KAI7898419.1 hypothetical protein BX663DRAFT_262258 [Cokeromyces recurvatus]
MTCSNLPTPSLTAQWFHAIDSPILDPIAIRKEKREKKPPKPRTPSKKWILFSKRDNLALERAYKNELDKMNNNNTIVPVNEDYLFQVNLLKREISPIYWEGPVFEVRRATWFMQVDGVWLPCEETLAYQIEEGYQKHKPYQCIIDNDSNNHNHETTAELDLGETTKEKVSQLIMTEELQQTTVIEEEEGEGEKRETLVDPYTNQYIIYNNAYQAWLR